jgi:hypothetical protein
MLAIATVSAQVGASCVSRTWCQAVGWSENTEHVLTEQWNGQAWSRIPNPEQATLSTQLKSVACVARTWCAAVGVGNFVFSYG